MRGHLEVAKFLFANGARINARNNDAIRWASYHGHLNVVKFLVENGADIHTEDDIAICFAGSQGHVDLVKYFLECGVQVPERAKIFASRCGQSVVLKMLELHEKHEF